VGFGFPVWDSCLGVFGGFKVQGLQFTTRGLASRVQDFESRVQDLKFGVLGIWGFGFYFQTLNPIPYTFYPKP
jgi:hypothetical protein